MNNETSRELQKIFRTALMSYFSMIGALVCYGFVAFSVNHQAVSLPPSSADVAPMQYIFFGLALLSLALSWPIKKIILAGKLAANSQISSYGSRLFMASVTSWAFCEAVALYGLILFFMSRNINQFYLFVLISLTGLAAHFPKFSEWETWFENKSTKDTGNRERK